MNILFVHEVDLLNKVVFEIHNLAEILSKNHNVFAVDYEESWKRKNIFDPGTLRTQEFKNVSRAYNGRGFTLRRPGMIKFPLLSRLSAFFTHYCEIENIIKEEKIDAIILYSAPTNGMQTIYLAKKYNIPVIFRSIDILNQLVPPGEKLPLRFAMMRHDIDRKPMRALLTARVEQELGIRATYYFGRYGSAFRPEIMKEIEAWGTRWGIIMRCWGRRMGIIEIKITEIIWLDDVVDKIRTKHNMTVMEIEEFFKNEPSAHPCHLCDP